MNMHPLAPRACTFKHDSRNYTTAAYTFELIYVLHSGCPKTTAEYSHTIMEHPKHSGTFQLYCKLG